MALLRFFLVLVIVLVQQAHAAGVRLERLADFDADDHQLNVAVFGSAGERCLVDTEALRQSLAGALKTSGFQVDKLSKSELQYALLIGVNHSDAQHECNIRLKSMVRQVPNIRVLRRSPNFHSTEFELWAVDEIVHVEPVNIQNALGARAAEDLVAFLSIFGAEQGK